jgi:tRNA 2-thiouridine synthesizing protein D
MANVAMILKRSPYGDINAAEAVRHALGAVSFEMSVDLILVDGGVLLAKKGQDDAGTGFTNLEGALKDCVDMGVNVYADTASLKAQGVASNEVVENIKLAGAKEIAGLLKEAKSTMIF